MAGLTSLLRQTFATIGELDVRIYDYVLAGDVLPMHVHSEADEHIIIVARGRIGLRITNTKDGTVAETNHSAGAVVDTFAGWPHEIIGAVDDTRTIHIQKRITHGANSTR